MQVVHGVHRMHCHDRVYVAIRPRRSVANSQVLNLRAHRSSSRREGTSMTFDRAIPDSAGRVSSLLRRTARAFGLLTWPARAYKGAAAPTCREFHIKPLALAPRASSTDLRPLPIAPAVP